MKETLRADIVGLFSASHSGTRVAAAGRSKNAVLTTRIALLVGVAYFACSLFIYRGIAASIPLVLRGEAVINGDELVPFFNPTSQLIDQAAGKFNQLTNGYEFRVRYSFLTTWMRYYKVLPFAIILVIPGVTYVAYQAVSRFLAASLADPPADQSDNSQAPALTALAIYMGAIGPVAVIFLIMAYSKITHFYTLILGFSMFLTASLLATYGLIFAKKHPYRIIAAGCLVTLLNPAIHYLVLFCLFLGMTVASLVLMEIVIFLRAGGLRRLFRVREWLGPVRAAPRTLWQARSAIMNATLARCILAFVLLAVVTVVPYALMVKFFFLRGVPNISETVPGDFYFITDASISLGHVLAFDMAGIMDKMMTGDYLAKQPRWSNAVYMVLTLMPLFLAPLRRQVFNSKPRRAFLFVAYVNVFFSMWATLGYSDPGWLPTFHRTIAFISRTAYGMQSTPGDLIVKLTSTIVQVLRFPHRFQLILFMMACVLMPISVAWLGQQAIRAAGGLTDHLSARRQAAGDRPARTTAWQTGIIWPVIVILCFVPLFSSWQYRETFFSGNYRDFFAPYPVTPLQDVKNTLLKMPPGKVVVLPPTETAKVIVDISGVEHKFIDKFHIYYLDLPSYYYGLTGDSDNKFEFFLLLRALYYQQGWWINIARDLSLRYIVINKELMANTVGGAEYLREIEKVIIPELDRRSEYLRKVMENDSYVLYEFTDLPVAARVPLLIDSDWNSFIQVLASRLDLTRHYDLRHTVVSDDLLEFDNLVLLTDDPHIANLDLYIKANPTQFFVPSSSIFAFNPDIVPSSYYLSPMFRLFQFFSDSKWNRINMITPGLFGTIKGSFVAVPRSTVFRIDAKFPEDGKYRILLRGAATLNHVIAKSKSLGYEADLELRATPDAITFFDQRTVFAPDRQPLDIGKYSVAELERLIPGDVVAINYRYKFFDLGVVEGKKGVHTFYFDKQDNSPLLVEGILVIPEEAYQNLALPENVQLLNSPKDLCCREVGQDNSGP